MKLLNLVLLFALLVFVQADSFEIRFYSKPNYKHPTGEIHGEIDHGHGSGVGRKDMMVRSFMAPDWMYVTFWEGYGWQGRSYTYKGSQRNIPPIKCHSVTWRYH